MAKTKLAISLFTSAAIMIFAGAAHSNLVTDPGFESGGSGWTFIDNAGPDNRDPTHSGTWTSFVNSGGLFSIPPNSGSISQDISTIAGHNYSIDLWTASNGATGEIIISFGSAILFDIVNPSFPVAGSPNGNNGYTELQFNAIASGASTNFSYAGLNVQGTYFLDDVAIIDLGAVTVPEPGTLGLLVMALVSLGAFLRYHNAYRSL